MKRQSSLAIALMFALVAPVFGQNPATPPPPQDDEDVVRITTNLVQVDAVVTDKNGRQVTDLRADEFEIQENGETRQITNFSYVPLAAASTKLPTTAAAPTTGANAPPAPPPALKPEQVRRTIALVVDDLGLSFQSVAYVRRALKKFVDEQMQPGDLVAVIRTAGGVGALQQFTSDKRQLYAAIERIAWYRQGRGGISPYTPMEGRDIVTETRGGLSRPPEEGIPESDLDEFSEEFFTVGTLGAIDHIINGLRNLPGRKSVMLFSDGMRIRG
ncbi:MAG: VWA domain-containing protein, partial [Pyrinomonadaceae bacterium]|nr:VWA domain-containing protein [Pyrinomonadaceae bacterium]